MFNEFTSGDKHERENKLQHRLQMLKRAREDGFFDEEGTEEVTVKAAGINPCDLGHTPFTGETPKPKPGERDYVRPMGVLEAERRRAMNECWKCKGLGDLVMYGDVLERCPECKGTGRNDTFCFVCTGRGHDMWGKTCTMCDGRGLEPA